MATRFPRLSRSHQRETRNLEPQSGDLWPSFRTVNTGTMYFKLFYDSFLAYIYNLISWRDYSCINLSPERKHLLLRVISWLTTLEGSNHFLKRIWELFMRAQQTERHFLCFVKLHCTYFLCYSEVFLLLWIPCLYCIFFLHVHFSVSERCGYHVKTIMNFP